MIILCVCCIVTLYQNSQAQNASKDSVEQDLKLQELVIKAKKIIAKGDHQLLHLSKENREFGTNALDAVSSLNYFRTKLNENELTSFDHKNVFILINGIPSSAFDLKTYKGEDIKSVEYYPVAPARYMAFTSGPVANIIMKKHESRLYTAYLNTNNAINTGFGTNQTSLTYADSLNQIKINHLIDYRNIGDINLDSHYDYGKEQQTFYRGKDNRYKGIYQFVQMSYQRFQKKHLLNANIKYLWNPRQQNNLAEVEIIDGANRIQGSNGNELKSYSQSWIADFYYNYLLGKNRSVALNMVNTWSKANSDQHLWQQLLAPHEAMNYNLDNNIKNHTYSFISDAVYSSNILGGSFNMGARYEYLHLRQNNADKIYHTTLHKGYLYSGIYWQLKNITIYPAIGIIQYKQNTTAGNSSATIEPKCDLY
ncbi:hypothetical protein [Porphyromonas pogonae]|uniref:hypothetical protein n=1 Tax=Porphyromonas pogonae TaxID=867595 RepID=UPI002E76943C|nr:hypothetical protein [Porphyromonas pogonae]